MINFQKEVLHLSFFYLVTRAVFTDANERARDSYSNVTFSPQLPQCSVDWDTKNFILDMKLTEDGNALSPNETNDRTIKYILRTSIRFKYQMRSEEFDCKRELRSVSCRVWKIGSTKYFKSNSLSLVRISASRNESNDLNEHEVVVWRYNRYIPQKKHFTCYGDHDIRALSGVRYQNNGTESIRIQWEVNLWDLKYFKPNYVIYENDKLIKNNGFNLQCERTKCMYEFSRASGERCNQDVTNICIKTFYPKNDFVYTTCADVNSSHGNCIPEKAAMKFKQDIFGIAIVSGAAFVTLVVVYFYCYVKKKKKRKPTNKQLIQLSSNDMEPVYEEITPQTNIYNEVFNMLEDIGHRYDSITFSKDTTKNITIKPDLHVKNNLDCHKIDPPLKNGSVHNLKDF